MVSLHGLIIIPFLVCFKVRACKAVEFVDFCAALRYNVGSINPSVGSMVLTVSAAPPFSRPKAATSPLRTVLPFQESPVFRSASSDCAPCFPFGKARCSAWLILHKQSTGLFIPKRSCFRASPLHRRTVLPLRESPVFRSASSDCAPCFPFRKARCSGRLILHKQSTGLFTPKRSTSRASPLRGTVHRTVDSETLDLQGFAPPRDSPQDCLFRNARPSGLRPSAGQSAIGDANRASNNRSTLCAYASGSLSGEGGDAAWIGSWCWRSRCFWR